MKINNNIAIALLLVGLVVACAGSPQKKESNGEHQESKTAIAPPEFNADSAYRYIKQQVDFGPRVPQTKAHKKCLDYLTNKLIEFKAEVVVQTGEGTLYNGKKISIKNIIGSYQPEKEDRILLCAHWDSRPFADRGEKSKLHTPIDGANDGASGVGVLLEIARNIADLSLDKGIDIIFFDVEDYGTPAFEKNDHFESQTWCIGSQYWALNPHKRNYKATFGILLDMVGAPNAKFYKEHYSLYYAQPVVDRVWEVAEQAGFSNYFINQRGGVIIDDHLPVNQIRRIPCINIIHFDPNSESGFGSFWHTVNDNMSNIDKKTIKVVGQTVLNTIVQ